MIIVKGFIILVLTCFSLQFSAQEIIDSENSLLWEISKEGVSHKSYLFGTHHFVSSSFIDTSAQINKILQNADVVAMEITGEYIFDTLKIFNLMKMKDNEYYNYPAVGDEKILKDYMETDPKLKPLTKVYHLIKPIALWMIVAFGDMSFSGTTPGYTTIDDYFKNEAVKLNKISIGLETYDEQFSMFFDSISTNDQLKILMQTIKAGGEMQNLMTDVLENCYVSQNMECMSQFKMFEDINPIYQKLFLDNRNVRWVNSLEQPLGMQSHVVAVGAGHLPGTNGLINLLRQKGFTVQPLKF